MPIVAIVGGSDSGKTLLAEQVTAALVAEGRRVGYVKHAAHGFEPGRADTDSERVRAAGADPVVVLGPDGLVELRVGAGEPAEQLAQLLTGLRGDVILLEGFSASTWPKIRVCRTGDEPREVAEPVIVELERDDGQRFDDDQLARVLTELGHGRPTAGGDEVHLHADGHEVPLRGFAETVVAAAVRGVTEPLRGVADPDELTVQIRRMR